MAFAPYFSVVRFNKDFYRKGKPICKYVTVAHEQATPRGMSRALALAMADNTQLIASAVGTPLEPLFEHDGESVGTTDLLRANWTHYEGAHTAVTMHIGGFNAGVRLHTPGFYTSYTYFNGNIMVTNSDFISSGANELVVQCRRDAEAPWGIYYIQLYQFRFTTAAHFPT